MAEEANVKSYTSKIKINGSVYWLKDDDARNLLAKLEGADTVEGSILNSIKLFGKDATYGETTLATALGTVETKVATLEGDKTVDGSVAFQIYNNSKDAIYSITPAVTREATEEDVSAGLASEVGAVIVVTPAKVTTIQEAIKNAANSIGNLTVNGIGPAEGTTAITIDAGDIDRADGSETVEASITALEGRTDAVEGRLNVLEGDVSKEGSVLKTVKDTAVNATYTEATGAVGEENSEGYVPAKPRVTIGEAIKANTDAVKAEVTRATSAESALSGRLDILEGEIGTTGSVKDTVYNKAGDATFTFTGAETATTIKAAIQANADAIIANKTGSFKVVNSTNDIVLSEEGLGIIYLVKHDPTENNAANESVPVHYDEYIVITEDSVTYKFEKIGDTEITLAGYATQNWVIENAKDAILTAATTRKPTKEEIESGKYTGDENIEVPAVTIAQAIEALQNKVKEGTEQLRADLNAEIARATAAEEALDGRVTITETAIETLNNNAEVAGSVANSVKYSAKDAVYTTAKDAVTHIVTAEENADESSPYFGKGEGTVVEVTPAVKAKTLAEGIADNTAAIKAEETRAKAAEKSNADAIAALDNRVVDIEGKVTGKTVKSVNGVEANESNGGAIKVTASDTEYKAATPASGIPGEADYVAPKDAVTIADALDSNDARLTNIEGKTVTQTINGVNSTVTGNFKDGVTINTNIDAKDIKMDKSIEGSSTVFDKINSILSSTASAITSVSIKANTGTWAVDTNDTECLNWTDAVIETNDATFLVPSAE